MSLIEVAYLTVLFSEGLNREQELQAELSHKIALLEALSSDFVKKAKSVTDLKKKATPFLGHGSDLREIERSTKVVLRDIDFIRGSRLLRFLVVIGYNKEGRLIDAYNDKIGPSLGQLLPNCPTIATRENIQTISQELNSALDILSLLSSHENGLATLEKELTKFSAECEALCDDLAGTSKFIDDASLVPAAALEVDPGEVENFKAFLCEKDRNAANFTKEQWDFILSTSRNTYVVAGAGSGKSSTLVYRALFLRKCAKVSLPKLVFSRLHVKHGSS